MAVCVCVYVGGESNNTGSLVIVSGFLIVVLMHGVITAHV